MLINGKKTTVQSVHADDYGSIWITVNKKQYKISGKDLATLVNTSPLKFCRKMAQVHTWLRPSGGKR